MLKRNWEQSRGSIVFALGAAREQWFLLGVSRCFVTLKYGKGRRSAPPQWVAHSSTSKALYPRGLMWYSLDSLVLWICFHFMCQNISEKVFTQMIRNAHCLHMIENKSRLLEVLLAEVLSWVMIVAIFLLLLKHKRTEGRPDLDKQGSQSGWRVMINAKLWEWTWFGTSSHPWSDLGKLVQNTPRLVGKASNGASVYGGCLSRWAWAAITTKLSAGPSTLWL